MTFFNFLFIVCVFIFQAESGISFSAKKKTHMSDKVIVREWRLLLNREATFKYTIINSIRFKGKSLVKKDTLLFDGIWRYDGDTLFLYSDICINNIKREAKYLRKGEYLYSLGACVDSLGNQGVKKLKRTEYK